MIEKSTLTLHKKMKGALSEMENKRIFQLRDCDQILEQYGILLMKIKGEFEDSFASFSMQTDRLDSLFVRVAPEKEYPQLWELLRIVFILSHGQADVERGFSINKDVIRTNMVEKTIVTHRIVYEGVKVRNVLL